MKYSEYYIKNYVEPLELFLSSSGLPASSVSVRKKKKNLKTELRRKRNKAKFFIKNPNCFYCGILLTKKSRTIDHFIPLSKGGTNTQENWRAACKQCNHEKGDNLLSTSGNWHFIIKNGFVAQLVECVADNDEVASSNLAESIFMPK